MKFYWGVSTAAAQIEGASEVDDKTKSIWDIYNEQGRIAAPADISKASDSYHHYKEDIQLIKKLGCNAYRFSISWTRIISNVKTNQVNLKGIRYYNDVINECLKNDITPFVTIFHWDLPYEIYLDQGYLNENFPLYFEQYTKVLVHYFGDRVKNWFTLNEPQNIVTALGGVDKKYTPKEYFQMVINILKGHGLAYRVLKEDDSHNKVSIAYAVEGIIPYRDSIEDIQASLKRQFGVAKYNPRCLSLWCDPVIFGDFPKEFYALNQDELPTITPEDLSLIHTGLDFFGLNLYTGFKIKSDGHGDCIEVPWDKSLYFLKDGVWAYAPEALYYGLKNVYERYHLPIIVAENGGCVKDELINGTINDPLRCQYISEYIHHMLLAKDNGIDIQGYFVWSLLDNVEWFSGYQRFGLVYVDFATFKRIPKQSYYCYLDIIQDYKNKENEYDIKKGDK